MTFFRVSPLSGCVLDRITHADDLGVYMDPKLKFSDYITTMVKKRKGKERKGRNSMIPMSQRPCLFH